MTISTSPLKWVGSKRRTCEFIGNVSFSGSLKKAYIEPFVGGGSMMIEALKRLPVSCAFHVNDINPHLIGFYIAVRDDHKGVVKVCRRLINKFFEVYETDYQTARDIFSDAKKLVNTDGVNLASVKLAGTFLFLNRTSFNGYWREGNPDIGGKSGIRRGDCEKAIRSIEGLSSQIQRVNFYCLPVFDFIKALPIRTKGSNTLFYLDPPYPRTSDTSPHRPLYTSDDETPTHSHLKILKKYPKASISISYPTEFTESLGVTKGEVYTLKGLFNSNKKSVRDESLILISG